MTLVMRSLPLARDFLMFVYIHTRVHFALVGGNLTARWTGSHRGTGGGIQISEMLWQALLPFPVLLPELPPPPRRDYSHANSYPG